MTGIIPEMDAERGESGECKLYLKNIYLCKWSTHRLTMITMGEQNRQSFLIKPQPIRACVQVIACQPSNCRSIFDEYDPLTRSIVLRLLIASYHAFVFFNMTSFKHKIY